MNINMLFSGIT